MVRACRCPCGWGARYMLVSPVYFLWFLAAKKQFSVLVHEEAFRNSLILVLSNVKSNGDDMLVRDDELKTQLGIHEIDPTINPISIFSVNSYNSLSFRPVLEKVCKYYSKK